MKYKKIKGSIACGHKLTAQAGKEILKMGGNAFDALVGAYLVSCVVEPMLTSLAGGGFGLVHTKKGGNVLYDFFSQTPKNKNLKNNPDFFGVDVNFGATSQTFHIGMSSMAVPGCAAGVFTIHEKHGRLPIKEIIKPAVETANNGYKLNNYDAYVLRLLKDIFKIDKESREVFFSGDEYKKEGDLIVMKNFAKTLEQLVKEGWRSFYEGDIAEQIAKDSKEKGGYLTLDDLRDYKVIERKPLEIDYRGNKLVANPPPSSGGTLIAFALKLLEGVDVKKHKHGSAEHMRLLAEVMAITNEARAIGYNDSLYKKGVAEKFLSEGSIKEYVDKLSDSVNKWGSTTHISIIDEEGNVASMTTSNGEGSGYVIPGTGVMMNNMLGEEDLNPNGFHKWKEDVRISSMMSPTIVLKDSKPELALGSGGSNRIRTAIFQVISNIIDFKMPVNDAVQAPRVHWERGNYNIETEGLKESDIENIKDNAERQGDNFIPFPEKNMFFGGVHCVEENKKGIITGAGDPRRNGVCLECK